MDEKKRKKIEAKLSELFTQTSAKRKTPASKRTNPVAVTVIRRRKGAPTRYFTD
jgi:hypothetical protein